MMRKKVFLVWTMGLTLLQFVFAWNGFTYEGTKVPGKSKRDWWYRPTARQCFCSPLEAAKVISADSKRPGLFCSCMNAGGAAPFNSRVNIQNDLDSQIREPSDFILSFKAAAPLEPEQQEKINFFLREIERLLPPLIRERLGHPILIEFTEMGESFKNLPSPSHIQISSRFLPEILKGPENATSLSCHSNSCQMRGSHRTLYQLAMATVIEEIAQQIDSVNGFSKAKYFKRLIGWKRKTSWMKGYFRKPKPRNLLTHRSPDVRENWDLSEYFSVNFAYFLLDPEFPCRRPSLNSYFEKIFSMRREATCQVQYWVPVRNRSFVPDTGTSPWLDLNPDRIYAIHLLHGEPGKALASRLGHTMFRLIGCAPEREVGPDCLKDVSYHTVVNFSAVIEEAVSGVWKGLNGTYRSQIFINSLEETIESYTRNEFRGLTSFPLKLTSEEKSRLIHRLLELYWGYQSSYFFLWNNCVTEAVSLLKSVFDLPGLSKFKPTTPVQLLNQLSRLGLLDRNAPETATELKNSLTYPSEKTSLEEAFYRVSASMNERKTFDAFPYGNLESYFNRSSSEERRMLFQAMKSAPGEILQHFYQLESFIDFKKTRKLNRDAYMKLEKFPTSPLYQEIQREALKTIPVNQAQRGYGIPTLADFDRFPPETEISVQLKQDFEAWKAIHFPEESAELKQIHANLRFLKRTILKRELQSEAPQSFNLQAAN